MEKRWLRVAGAGVAGLLFYGAFRLTPVWWAAWLAPMPILWAACRAAPREARVLAWGAAAMGVVANLTYYATTTGPVVTTVILVLQVLAWGFLVLRTRAVILASRHWTVVLVFPLLLAAVDTVVVSLSPHGTWGSLAYSQMDALWVIQVASVAGTAGVVFLVGLLGSIVAVALHRGRHVDRPVLAYGLPLAILVGGLGYGAVRLSQADRAPTTRIGIASVDDFIPRSGPPARAEAIRRRYEDIVNDLVRRGARIVVLPEKIETLTPADVDRRREAVVTLARTAGATLVVGLQLNRGDRRDNVSWLVSPRGEVLAEYLKQRMVPHLEGDLTPGTEDMARTVGGTSYGLAICRDLIFEDLGRRYGRLGVSALLVPAWDFYRDAWMASEIAAMRGVENGYSVVRAGRESYLQASDRFGRVVVRQRSAFWPGAGVVADVPLGPPAPTIYTRAGNSFGWVCVGLAALTFLHPKRERAGTAVPIVG